MSTKLQRTTMQEAAMTATAKWLMLELHTTRHLFLTDCPLATQLHADDWLKAQKIIDKRNKRALTKFMRMFPTARL